MLKAIAFDFDGVLFESVNVKTQAFQRLFEKEPPEQLDQILEYHLRNGGISRFEKFRVIHRDILQRPLSDKEFQRLCDRFAEYVVDEVLAAPWVPGAKEFLDRNRDAYQFFVVSATPDSEIKNIIRRKGLQAYFAAVLGAPRKKAILLKQLLDTYRVSPAELVYVGDAINDWQAANQLGIPFIWRRASKDIPILPDYTGPCVFSLIDLEQALSAYLTPMPSVKR